MDRELLYLKTVLISTSDKTGLLPLCRLLHQQGCTLIATRGTAQMLAQADLPVTPVESISSYPEAFHGRMKTLSFQLCAGILYRRDDPSDCAEAQELGIVGIDMVVANLYPFHQQPVAQMAEAAMVDLVDIGGPTLLRAAAKNFRHVAVLSDPLQYREFMETLQAHGGGLPFAYRQKLAALTFQSTAAYEEKIATEFARRYLSSCGQKFSTSYSAVKELRYGENPQQKGYLLLDQEGGGIAHCSKLQGKTPSYNNYLDGDAAMRCTADLVHYVAQHAEPKPHVVTIVKHQSPCGAAMGMEQVHALEQAWLGDPKSAFGSVLCFSQPVDREAAQWLKDKFIEVIIAPSFSEQALNIFAGKADLRLLKCPVLAPRQGEMLWRSISGGFLLQEEDWEFAQELQQVSKLEFPRNLFPLVRFGIVLSKHLKSNSIALVSESQALNYSMIGAGMGQPNRVDSLSRLALPRAFVEHGVLPGERVVLVSDGFFPFPDIVQEAALHGIRYVVQPGGSIRDGEVIAACDRLGVSMLLTGKRHFRH
jgi:phosphoribosylaminoimidazolecarboxamide formyltransferase/IMP cyclohydrolase